MLLKFMICFLVMAGRPGSAFYSHFSVPKENSPLTKLTISNKDRNLYIGGKNMLLHLNFDLQEIGRDIIGPVNNSKQCKPFETSCIYKTDTSFVRADNDVSILKLYKMQHLIVCGTAHQGLCYMYNASNISNKEHFKDRLERGAYRNFVGSENSSVMYITKSKENYDMFFIGQSYDGRKLEYFYKEFAILDISSYKGWSFDHYAAYSFLSVCDSKKNSFKIKYLFIFEAEDFIFHIFTRSFDESGTISYETRISKLCKNKIGARNTYEEMSIYCKTPTKFNIGLSAYFYGNKLYMTFGVRTYMSGLFEADDTQGSVLCSYTVEEIKAEFDSEVLTKCFKGDRTLGTPSWYCGDRIPCPQAHAGEVFTSCNQTEMKGIEARGDGFSKSAFFEVSNELLTSVIPLKDTNESVVIVGSNTGYLRKILVVGQTGTAYAKIDVSGDRSMPVSDGMELDEDKNLYLLAGNKVAKVSMTSCRLHETCGSCVTSKDPLECGWCYDHCSRRNKCGNKWHAGSCPPFIHSMYPTSGPIEGLTRLIIAGLNFGNRIDSRASVSINTVNCTIQSLNDTSIFCLTGRIPSPVSDTVKIKVTDTDSKYYRIDGIAEQNVTFDYMISELRTFFPTKGPISGNTMITITGQNFTIGSSLTVMVGPVKCDIQRVSTGEIFCQTSSCSNCPAVHNENNIASSNVCLYTGNVEVNIDGTTLQAVDGGTFCYMENPEITPSRMNKTSIVSGGLNINIDGKWFDSVTNHSMVTVIGDFSTRTPCQLGNKNTQITCLSPDLRTHVNITSGPLIGQIKVLLDNNTGYTTDITIYPDPELAYLDENTQIREIGIEEKILELKGKYLDFSLRKYDIRLTINGSHCPVIELHRTMLRCNLSDIVHVKDVALPVKATAGYWEQDLGHIEFIHMELKTSSSILIKLLGIGICVVLVLIICIFLVMKTKHLAWFKTKHFVFSTEYHNNQEGEVFIQRDTTAAQNVPPERYVRTQQAITAASQGAEGASSNIVKAEFDAIETTNMLKEQNIYIVRDRVRLGQDIGHGNFGCVYKGYLLSEEDTEDQLVAVKTILKTGVQDVNAFLDEAMFMKDFDHPNVLSLIGISLAPGEFPLVILPFMANGDLLSYIRNEKNAPTVKDLVKFGFDVARGMEYLGSIKFVHRDLAARNCMLDVDFIVKVADFGLARDIYTKNYYSCDNKKMLPVKWMAPESLDTGTYTIKSDVWSYGVVMWELTTRGSAPYSDVNNWEMLEYLETGRRLKRPNFCMPPLYDIMLNCWEMEPDNRPSFHDIIQRITELMEQYKF